MRLFHPVSRLGLVLLLPSLATASATRPTASAPAERIAVPLEKIPALKEKEEIDLVRGHLSPCETQPAAEVKYPPLKGPKPLYGRAEFDRNVAAARTQVGEDAFAAAWQAGQAMTLEQAIECALNQADCDA